MTARACPPRDRWLAAQHALSRVMPEPVGRILLQEPRMLVCLLRWLAGRRPAGKPGRFSYHQSRTLLTVTFAILIAVETGLLHLVFMVTVGTPWWVWLITATDAYTVIWILGFYASLVVLPHYMDHDTLYLRYGFLSDLTIPLAAITAVRSARHTGARSGKLTCDHRGQHHYPCGDTTVTLQLDPTVPLTLRGQPVTEPIHTLHLSADNPTRLVNAIAR